MWLGKALFLKGEDRRGQAIEEYREGVRVLEQSKVERRSSSMALFRWYLGTALLDLGEVKDGPFSSYRDLCGMIKESPIYQTLVLSAIKGCSNPNAARVDVQFLCCVLHTCSFLGTSV